MKGPARPLVEAILSSSPWLACFRWPLYLWRDKSYRSLKLFCLESLLCGLSGPDDSATDGKELVIVTKDRVNTHSTVPDRTAICSLGTFHPVTFSLSTAGAGLATVLQQQTNPIIKTFQLNFN